MSHPPNELPGLAALGVQVVEQADLEQRVHSQAARDVAQHNARAEHTRRQRADRRLARLHAELGRARDAVAHAKSTAGVRYQNALAKIDRLEAQIQELEESEAAEHLVKHEDLAAMLVPRRRAAAAAEQRNSGLAAADEEHNADEERNADEESDVQSHGSDAYEPKGLDGLESDSELGLGSIAARRAGPQDSIYDDGDEAAYQQRVLDWCEARWRQRNSETSSNFDSERIPRAQLLAEPFLADPGTADHEISAHEPRKPVLRVPRQIWARLLGYQRAGLRWLFALHQQGAGGIIGDEMGLGKTVQTAAFLAALYHSKLLARPSLIVCPATLMRQWVREFHKWWPALRVAILHNTGAGMRAGDAQHAPAMPELPADAAADAWASARAANPQFAAAAAVDPDAAAYDSADDYVYDAYGSRIRRKRKPRGTLDWRRQQQRRKREKKRGAASDANLQRARRLVDYVQQHGHVLVVTYAGLQMYGEELRRHAWGYAVLDEGHMIRNPDADATLAAKQLDTRHRLLVTGTPIQNSLTELWSLFDFVQPGRLGTLPVFTNQFAVPITVGGYAGASALQVRAAVRCAGVLRDLIEPYMLRRLKADVARELPQKSEQVLFCRLTDMQRRAYEAFLTSAEMRRILDGRLQMLFGVDVVRKICDHPDLLLLSKMAGAEATHRTAAAAAQTRGSDSDSNSDSDAAGLCTDDPAYGDWRKSGKLTIVRALLQLWHPQGHKVLLFSQTRQMLDILERLVRALSLPYRRMDGATPVQRRAQLVDEFNADKSVFVFLLTTRVGGLGVNLTGADRVILYSPDWNPSSDAQARERAWRLGQSRNVAVYRLMTAGTIEEKIYSRQIYKQFLSSRVLEDPQTQQHQQRVFQSQTLQDLFALADDVQRGQVTETGRLFAGAQLHPAPAQSEAAQLEVAQPGADPSEPDALSSDTRSDDAPITAIGGVVRLEAVEPSAESDSEPAEPAAASEDRVLQSLFKMSGMHSALQHDAIVGGRAQPTDAVDREAARIAQGARTAL
ncbi:DNA repair protein rhp26, partial [Coemansia sp. RSA 2610]